MRGADQVNTTHGNNTQRYPSQSEPRFAAVILDYYPAPIQINPANGHYIVQVYPSLHLSGTASNTQIRIRMIMDYSYIAGAWGNLAIEVMDFGRSNGSLAVAPNGGAPGTLREVAPVDFTLGGANGALLDLITGKGLILDTIRNFSTFEVGTGSKNVNDENRFISLLCRKMGLPIPSGTKDKLDQGTTFAAWWAPKLKKKPNAIYLSDVFGPLRRWSLEGEQQAPRLIYDRLGLRSLTISGGTNQTKRSLPRVNSRYWTRANQNPNDPNQRQNQRLFPDDLIEAWPMNADEIMQPDVLNMNPAFPLAAAEEHAVDAILALRDEILALPEIDDNLLRLWDDVDQAGLPNVLPEAGFAAAENAAAANIAPDDPVGAVRAVGDQHAHAPPLEELVPDIPPNFPPAQMPENPDPIRENGAFRRLQAQQLNEQIDNIFDDMNDPVYDDFFQRLLGDVDHVDNPRPNAEQIGRAENQLRDLNWLANARAYGAVAAQAINEAGAEGADAGLVANRQAVAQEILEIAESTGSNSPYRRYLSPDPEAVPRAGSPNALAAALNDWEPHLAGLAVWGPAGDEGYAGFFDDEIVIPAVEEGAGDAASGTNEEGPADVRGGRPASVEPEGSPPCRRQRIEKRGKSAPCVSGTYDLDLFKKSSSKVQQASLLVHNGVNHVITNLNPAKLLSSIGALGLGGIALGVVLVIVDWSPKMGYASLAFGLAGAITGTIVAALAPSGPIGWIIGGIIDAIFTVLGALLIKKPPPPGISNGSQIIQYAFFGDRDHTGNEKCQAQAEKAASQNDCAKAGLNADCNDPRQCQVVYGAGFIAAAFGWMVRHSIAFLTWANNGHGMTIPDMAAKLAVFNSQDEADRNTTAVFYVICDNHDPLTCQKAQFRLRHDLIRIPHVNVTADKVYDRLVDVNNKGDCVMLYDSPNGFALPDVGLTVYGRPYGFACGLSEIHNFSTNATYRPTDVPIYGNHSGLAGDSSEIAPAYSLSSNSSNGEAGQGHVDAPPPKAFLPLTVDNAACFDQLCVPSGVYRASMMKLSDKQKVTVPKGGGRIFVITEGGSTITLAPPWTVQRRRLHDVSATRLVREQGSGEDSRSLQSDLPLERRVYNQNFHLAKERPAQVNVTLTKDPPCVCLFNDVSYLGDKVWCFGVGGGDLPDEAGSAVKSLRIRGNATAWLYLDHYNDNTAGAPYTADVEDLTKVLLGDGTTVANKVQAMWVKGQ